MSDIPYSNRVEQAIASGSGTTIALPAPPRGVVSRLIVKQVDGALEGFTFDIYSRVEAAEDNSVSQDGTSYDPELYKLQATQTVGGGNNLSEQYGLALGYVNQDTRRLEGIPRTQIHIEITPGGSGNKTFQIAWTILSPAL